MLFVLAGVLLMHSLVLQPSTSTAVSLQGEHLVVSATQVFSDVEASAETPAGPTQNCSSTDCSDHSILHLCVAMLAAVGTALVLVLLRMLLISIGTPRITFEAIKNSGVAPPWAMPTLAKLSVRRL